MSDLTITLLILVVAVAFFVWNRLPVGIVALGVAIALWATGVLSLEQSLAGFGSTTVVLIAALFVVAEGLDAAGITTWAGQQVIAHAGDSHTRLMIFTMLVGALLSALITPNGAAAALVPMVVILAVRLHQSPSRLLMPLAYSAHAGSLLVLTGTPINVLVSEAAIGAGETGFRFFEFARVGIPLVIGTILMVVLFGSRLVPERRPKSLPRDLSALPGALARQYLRPERLARLTVGTNSPLIGTTADAMAAPARDDVSVLAVLDNRGRPVGDDPISAENVLLVRGSEEGIAFLRQEYGLAGATSGAEASGSGLIDREFGVAEVVITPRSDYVGHTASPGMVTESGELVVLAVQRDGEDLGPDDTMLRAGDTMLLHGSWSALDQHTADPNVMLVDTPDAVRRQAAPLGPRAIPALVILGAMVALLTTGIVPAVIAGLLAAIAMVLSGVVTVKQAHRAISWATLILVAGMIPLSTAITETGAADLLASTMIGVVGGLGPYALLFGLFFIAATVGQLISNTAIALILIPIALSISGELGVSPLPLLMCVNVASAAALLTPVATPANMMVMGPGGYQFGDYAKLGLPLMLLYLLVAVFLVPFWWPFSG